jgi:outer membrane protein TolC
MLKKPVWILLTVALVPIGLPALAEDAKQPALSLEDCINIALKNQVDVLVARNNTDAAKSRATQATSEYFPTVSVQNNTFRIGSRSVLGSSRTGTALTVTQNIYDGGLREALVQGSRYGVVENESGLARTVQTVTFDVTRAYYEVLRARHLSDVAGASVKYNEGLRELVEARVEAGDAAEADVLPVEAELANARVNLLSAQNTVRTTTIQLQNTMGLSPQPAFDVQEVDKPPETEIRALETYVSAAVSARPDIQQGEAGVGAARASVKSSRISLYPQPTITGEYQHGVGGLRSNSAQVFGGITLDVFNGNRNRAAYKGAKASQASAEERSKQVMKDVQAQVQEAYFNLTSAKERLAASDVGLAAAQKNYDVQEAKYKQGLAITLDMLNAELQVITAQTNAVQARYDYHIAIAQMEYAVGKQGGLNGA